jgi:hypothetical protein
VTAIRRRRLCRQDTLASLSVQDDSARRAAVCGSILRDGPACHLRLPAIGVVLAQQARLQKNLAQCDQSFWRANTYPRSAGAQHVGHFFP